MKKNILIVMGISGALLMVIVFSKILELFFTLLFGWIF